MVQRVVDGDHFHLLKLECLREKMSERFIILIHHNGEITNTTEGVTFYSQNPVGVTVFSSSITLLELQNTILRKLGLLN